MTPRIFMKRKHVILLAILIAIGIFISIPPPQHSFKELYKGSAEDIADDLYKLRQLPHNSVTSDNMNGIFVHRDRDGKVFYSSMGWPAAMTFGGNR